MDDQKKTILVGVTGCVAVYKTIEIVRGLQKRGFRVKVIMTEHACEFVTPLMFRSITREPVAVGLFEDAAADPIHHISLAQEADVMLIAPCTANVMAKLANGIADDLLTTTALATTAKLLVAPAMNVNMYEHPATRENQNILEGRGIIFIEPEEGYLACGDLGKGRLADIEAIVAATAKAAGITQDLVDKQVLITAGPTVEPIDPVRFISNHSSGKTGYALAAAAAQRGAEVVLVSGPTALDVPQGLVHFVPVKTALEMNEVVQQHFDTADIAICTAAVSDMRPAQTADHKLKKGTDGKMLEKIELVENPDILATLGMRKNGQYVIGFAAETDNVIKNAQAKLVSKKADCIVANEVGEDKAFGTEDNKVWLVDADGIEELSRMKKPQIAQAILDYAAEKM